ncbi:glycosyltransferase family protein [Drechmeria coniospora]|uniref:UDP-N-acetylglucosamine transferase subunit ALG14 n=1 Tax=Drechmeria coniospora TaxID=98403 RepID=A0A151GGH9_DRECN|nr:glycosyltransferase family protein [Drechmeria coniospora]KYK56210.1 glycosyltransferase family protein [Drechmeria coniospora]ODA78106.1 hypothetical protein RJ55_06709 [Drechmeria coniospora]
MTLEALSKSLLLAGVLLVVALAIFVTARHAQLVRRRRDMPWTRPMQNPPSRRSTEYLLFVLGSGGHTKEMLMMMDDGSCDFAHVHRRYLLSSGDHTSGHQLQDYESELARLCRARHASPGSHDRRIVTRARRVHQPLWSTPLTAVLSVAGILPVLLSPPGNEVGRRLRYPTQIFSNGPATGFFVALAVHLLKIFFVAPESSMRFVYVESWARISTLSLTGKLLYYTGLADAFYVQHDEVAAKYGLVNAGEMVFNARRPDG